MHSIAIVFIHPDLPPFIRISALKSHSFDFMYEVLNLLRKSYWKKVTVWCFCIQYMSGISFNSFLTAIYSATAPTTTKNNYFILNIRILHIDFNNRLLFISVRLFDSVLINRFRLLALCYAVIWFFFPQNKNTISFKFPHKQFSSCFISPDAFRCCVPQSHASLCVWFFFHNIFNLFVWLVKQYVQLISVVVNLFFSIQFI